MNIFASPPQGQYTPEQVFRLALEHAESGRLAQAEQLLRRLLAVAPGNPVVFEALASVLQGLGRLSEALAMIRGALAIRPDSPSAHNTHALILLAEGERRAALAAFEQALRLAPDYFEALVNRANLLSDLHRFEEALAALDLAIRQQPALALLHNNRGLVLQDMRRFDEALAAYGEARRLAPEFAEARWNEARCRLLTGDFLEGWRLHEARWQVDGFAAARNFSQPLWLGDTDLAGKTILLHGEQGFGDSLQFARYVPLVAARGARVLLEVRKGLRSLLESVAGVAEVIDAGDSLPIFDCHCPLMTLPLAFGTCLESIPTEVPYLGVSAERNLCWREHLAHLPQGLKIGIAWAGNPAHRNDFNRSMPLASLEPLLRSGAHFVSLQKAPTEAERGLLVRFGVADFSAEINDFLDTAALIEQLDLVISVDSAAAHLAGALGKPLWLALPFVGEWRWLLDRVDSPWYPTARLFRQGSPGDWQGLVAQMRQALPA
ncbi:tetratricopeptide repeat protein [Uliginosibacterium sp. 31-12]|uniref:tetratricopeptide repeat protein n=1 Tax=Uliginosibacterium sp. 31-12 TaxID=3062781 RepID=UPI0026E451AC|nr:tetratricopeptide repeat protein [Uliginosibacterium sp. 31-12]MDO6387396.1 tetratricopeptide repeat protein [Uliginosibacterium sp. 31-12]